MALMNRRMQSLHQRRVFSVRDGSGAGAIKSNGWAITAWEKLIYSSKTIERARLITLEMSRLQLRG